MATAEDIFQQGVAAHQAGDLAAAEQCYRQLLEVSPPTPPVSRTSPRHRPPVADNSTKPSTSTAKRSRPNPTLDAHFKLGNILRSHRATSGSRNRLRRSARSAPRTRLPRLVNLGLAVSDAGDLGARRNTLVAPRLLPRTCPDVLDLLGDALSLRPARKTIATLRESVAKFLDSPRGYRSLALQLLSSGAAEEAITLLERAAALRPDYADAHHLLGVALDNTGPPDEAQQEVRLTRSASARVPEALANLGVNLGEQGADQEGRNPLAAPVTRTSPRVRRPEALLVDLLCSSHASPEQLRDEHVAGGSLRQPVHAARTAPEAPA